MLLATFKKLPLSVLTISALGISAVVTTLAGQSPQLSPDPAPGSNGGKGAVLTISEGTGKILKPIFSSSYGNLEKLCRAETTPKISTHIAALGLTMMGYTVGSDVQWFHVFNEMGQDGEGLNVWPGEVMARMKKISALAAGGARVRTRDINTIISGRAIPKKDQYASTYPYWPDFVHLLKLAGSDFLMCPNIYTALRQYDGTPGSLDNFWKEFDRMVSDVHSAGHSIPIVQLGTESQLYQDLFPNRGVENYLDICNTLIPGIRQRLPDTVISGDIYGVHSEWSKPVASIPGIDAMRLYLQIKPTQNADYPGMRRRVNEDLPQLVDEFMAEYPGKRIVLLQMAVANQYAGTVAHGLYLAELYVRLAKLNLEKNDVIVSANQFNLKNLFSRDLLRRPPYFGMLAVKGIWNGVARNCTTDSAELVTLAVEKSDGYHGVVINPTDEPVTIDQVVVDGKIRDQYEVRGYYGVLRSTNVTEFDSLKMPGYSWASVFVPLHP